MPEPLAPEAALVPAPASSALLEAALTRDKAAVAALVALFEDPRAAACAERARVRTLLAARRPRAPRIGLTGAPGVGKSTLLGALARSVLAETHLAVACVAVDPSSASSGGALLGDRTRVRLPVGEPRVFFRSQASRGLLGGLAPQTFPACRVLELLFDVVVVETVGVGQSETAIAHLADETWLILAPGAGDGLQALKAGVMEVADRFVIGKGDLEGAAEADRTLRSALRLARPAGSLPVHKVSARTGQGMGELVHAVSHLAPAVERRAAGDAHFLGAWVRERDGRAGLERLTAAHGGVAALLATSGSFEAAQLAWLASGA